MSNLSELLPAGGAGKNVSFVASGTLPNGQAVVLKADGTVEAIAETAVSESIPLGSVNVVSTNVNLIHTAFDLKSPNIFVVAYTSQAAGASGYGYAVVGTVSGSSISFGTPVLFNAGGTYYMCLAVDPTTAGRFVIAYMDNSNSSYGTAIAGQISGTSISFGSETIFESASINYLGISFDTLTSGRLAVVYRDDGNSDYGTICIGTVSGTALTFGTPVVYHSGDTYEPRVAFDPNTANKLVVLYLPQTGSPTYQGYSKVGTLSGTSISFGSMTQFNTAQTFHASIAFDPNVAGKFIIAFRDAGNSSHGTAIIGTVSGTSVSYGSKYVYNTTGDTNYNSIVFSHHTPNKFIIAYQDELNSNYGAVIEGTVSGAAISFGTEVTHNSVSTHYTTAAFDPFNAGKFIIGYRNTTASPSNGSVILGQVAANVTNLTATNFIGMADAAIADTAAGSVTIKGGLAKSVSNIAPLISFSAPTEFNNGNTEYIEIAFDPNNTNKCVICYRDAAQSGYGKAIVGTVSGTSISFGTMEAHFNAGSTNRPSLAWDPDNSGKLVIAYADLGNSGQGTAVVGTVSGTSISFGSQVVFCSGETQQTAITFNSSNTCVITYRNEGNSNYGEGIVGTVSGTSISFGTASVFNSASTATNQVAADPNTANKVVVAYTNGATNPSTGGAAVGTVSGTSISWGSEQQFASTETAWVRMAFDPNNAGKFVIMWRDGAGSDGATIVGNVSGTSITYGAKTLFLAGANQSADNIAFDTNKANSIILSYNYSNGGKVVEGTITGNSIAYGTTFSYASNSAHNWVAIDPSAAGKFALAYQDGSDSSKGKVIMGQSSEALTTGSDYYVQADGIISTTSTSPAVKLGKALSTTSINLEFNT